MWECNFAEETVDYKLFWLRFLKKIWIIFAAAIVGSLVIGVPYYLINITFGPAPEYRIVTEYYLDYAADGSGSTYEYFNYYTWGEIVDTDEFIAILRDNLPKEMFANENTLRTYTDATVESDVRYLTTTVQTEHPDKTVRIARAMEQSIIDFADMQKELQAVRMVTQPLEAESVYADVRPVRAYILGAVLGLLAGLTGVCIYIICDSSVYLPKMLEKRYKIKALGCLSFEESKNNICYATQGAKNVTLVWTEIDKLSKSDSAVDFITENLGDTCNISTIKENVLSAEFRFDALRNSDAVILLVEAQAGNGKKIERVIDQMRRQDIVLSGAFLFGEDKKLIKRYYG